MTSFAKELDQLVCQHTVKARWAEDFIPVLNALYDAASRPNMNCASGTPSAARRSQMAACCSSFSTPTPFSKQTPRLKAATRSAPAALRRNQSAMGPIPWTPF
jgi:hypothetical protein